MKKKLLGFFATVMLVCSYVSAQETFKVMFYNLLNYPLEDAVPGREQDLAFILSDYQPDLFMVCELNNVTGANTVLNIVRSSISTDFEMATYISNTSDDNFGDQNDLQNLLYYDSTKFILEEEIIVPTDLRDFNIYKLKLNTVDQATNPIEMYVVVCHLKASSGTLNAQRRYEMVLELDAYLNTIPSDSYVILGGDLNLYTANEAAFQELLDGSNNIVFADPPNQIGSWNNNTNFVGVFTQSTRTQNGLGGTTGGFDDRFDFILTSENMMGTEAITYINDSYQVYGNNGLISCYNRAINSPECGNASSTFSFEVRDALHNFSDHLPVTLALQADVTLLKVNDNVLNDGISLENTVIDHTLVLNIESYEFFNKELYVYNVVGKKVKAFNTNFDTKQRFDISQLQRGLYFLSFENPGTQTLKFIVND